MNKPIKEEVLTTSTLVMYELIQKVHRELPDTKYVYDEGLSYETAIKAFRKNNNMNDSDGPPLPLLAFRRTILRYAEAMGGIGRRSVTKKATYKFKDADLDKYVTATIVQAEFDVEFAYLTKEVSDMERFEVAYLSQKGFTNGETLAVEVDELSETLQYQVDFKENLNDKTINVEENYYKAITGQFTVRGYFLVFKGEVKRIQSINLRIKTLQEEILGQFIIP